MNTPSRITESDQNSNRQQLMRLGYILAVVFAGTLITGVLVVLGFSASGCLLSRVIRCFSISRDAIGVTLIGLKIWSLPALITAFLIAAIVQVRGSVAWWNVLMVAALVSVSGFVVEAIRMSDLYEAPFFLAVSLVLFIGVQLSRLISRWVGKFPI